MTSVAIKIYDELKDKWKTKIGLTFELLVVFSITIYFFIIFTNTNLIIIAALLITVLWIVIWAFLSGRIILSKPNVKTIAFCFKVDTEAKRNYKRIFDGINQKLDDMVLDEKVRFIIISEDIISNRKEAVKFREQNNVDIVLWGNTFYGNDNSRRVTRYKFHSTFHISSSLHKKLDLFIKDIALFLINKKWAIDELNELNEIEILSDDFFETILFIIGLYYFDEQKFLVAIQIFSSILPISKRKSEGESDKNIVYLAQYDRIKNLLGDLYFVQSQEELEKGNAGESIAYLEKILLFDKNNISIYMNLARSYFEFGNLKKAEEYTLKIKKIEKNHPAVSINIAFFGILQKNYDRVYFWYNELLKQKSLTKVLPNSIIEFLENQYSQNPSEHSFLYGIAILNHFHDKSSIKKDLNKFISRTREKPEYNRLRERAIELIRKNR